MHHLKLILVSLSLCILPAFASAQATDDPPAEWRLDHLFPNAEAWDTERLRLLAEFDRIGRFKGTLGNSGDDLHAALQFVSDTYRDVLRVYVYATLQADEDLRVTDAQERNQLSEALYSEFSQATSWMDPEIVAVGETRIRQFMDDTPSLAPFRHELDDTLRQSAHTLSEETELALSALSQTIDAPGSIYGVLANSDIPFPLLEIDGEQARIDAQGYGKYRSHPDREVRKQVFDAYWGRWQEYRNSVGMVLASHIQAQVALARTRGFASVLDRELFNDNLPSEVYHTLVEEVNKALPTLHRYFRLRARMLGIEQMKYYDIYPPLVSLDKTFDLATSRDITLDAMQILGQDWVEMQRQAIGEGWMHVYPQQGKRSGAYMFGAAYDVHPYLLLNHNDDFESLSTFAHEWGHAMHTQYAKQAQPFETSGYATFIAEIPSTSLELILQKYMTDHAASVDEKLYYLGYGLENLRGTFFRQTMFAEFELALYEAVERGEALSGEKISAIYLEILKRYHGHDEGVVQIDDLYANEWMFVNHFYRNMYVFQYATSLTAGTALFSMIEDQGQAGVENYKNLLRSGESDYPYNLLRNAGVDLATPQPYQSVIAHMNAVMDEMETLLDQSAVLP